METFGFLTIISSPIWMAFIWLFATASRMKTTKLLVAVAVIALIVGHASYWLPNKGAVFFSESFIVVLATFVSAVLAAWALYAITRAPSDDEIVLRAAEAFGAGEDDRWTK